MYGLFFFGSAVLFVGIVLNLKEEGMPITVVEVILPEAFVMNLSDGLEETSWDTAQERGNVLVGTPAYSDCYVKQQGNVWTLVKRSRKVKRLVFTQNVGQQISRE